MPMSSVWFIAKDLIETDLIIDTVQKSTCVGPWCIPRFSQFV